MSQIQLFDFNGNGVRTAGTSENPMFCLKDVCDVFGLENSRQVSDRLDSDGVTSMDTIDKMGRIQYATFIDEANLYRVIFASRKPIAKKFQDWVVKEVIPAIRKTGSYSLPNPNTQKREDLDVFSYELDVINKAADVITRINQISPIAASHLSQRLSEQISTTTQPLLPEQRKVVASVRAQELGYLIEPGVDSRLGKFIKKEIEPIGKEFHGKYQVNVYPQSDHLDTLIHQFFS